MAEQTSAERFEEWSKRRWPPIDVHERAVRSGKKAAARQGWDARQPEIDALRQRIAELEGRLVAADRLAEAVRAMLKGFPEPGYDGQEYGRVYQMDAIDSITDPVMAVLAAYDEAAKG